MGFDRGILMSDISYLDYLKVRNGFETFFISFFNGTILNCTFGAIGNICIEHISILIYYGW